MDKKENRFVAKETRDRMINHKVTDFDADGMTNFGSYSPFTHSLKRFWLEHTTSISCIIFEFVVVPFSRLKASKYFRETSKTVGETIVVVVVVSALICYTQSISESLMFYTQNFLDYDWYCCCKVILKGTRY